MLSIDMLPARQGDALWIEYGTAPRRLLIDAGVASTWQRLKPRIEALAPSDRHFELLVISHIDNDHIAGSLPLLDEAESLGVTFGDIWFNGFRHLPETPIDSLGPVEGERLTNLLVETPFPWNEAFDGDAVCLPADGKLPSRPLRDGLKLTLLSPEVAQLEDLRTVWKAVIDEANLNPQVEPTPPVPLPPGIESLGPAADVEQLAAKKFKGDTAEANGSSIVVLLELDGVSAILAADAFPTVLERSVQRLLDTRGEAKLPLTAFKLPHHGSRANVNLGLLKLLDTPLYLISTDGTQTHHPNPEAVARVLVSDDRPRTLAFNYLSTYNEVWREPANATKYEYEVEAPADGSEGLAVTL
jgi:hypothetical protein